MSGTLNSRYVVGVITLSPRAITLIHKMYPLRAGGGSLCQPTAVQGPFRAYPASLAVDFHPEGLALSQKRNRGLKIYSPTGGYVLKYVTQSHLDDLLDRGEVALHKSTMQYRAVPIRMPDPELSLPTPATITFYETEANVGLHGPHAQKAAQNKIQAWAFTHDDRAVVICAGLVKHPVPLDGLKRAHVDQDPAKEESSRTKMEANMPHALR